jgi:hypothetical protein
MGTIYQVLLPEEAQFKTTAFPQYVRNQGTNFPASGLAYDAAAIEDAFFKLRAILYGAGDLTLDLEWYADTATSGVVRWIAQIAAITPNTDTQDVETDTLATANTVDDTHLGTTGQRLHRATITVTNLDSLAADDVVWLRIGREANHANDTMTGDAILVQATLSYSDT